MLYKGSQTRLGAISCAGITAGNGEKGGVIMDSQTRFYRLNQIEKVQESFAKDRKYNATIQIKHIDAKTHNIDISWSELCAIKNILTIESEG